MKTRRTTDAAQPVHRANTDISVAVNSLRRRFRDSPYGDLQRIGVLIEADSVRLVGEVSSYFLKQTAQEMVRTDLPRLPLRNELAVVDQASSDQARTVQASRRPRVRLVAQPR